MKNNNSEVNFAASYKDRFNCQHQRSVALTKQRLIVVDQLKGFNKNAVLRWRLKPGNWQLQGQNISQGDHMIITEPRCKYGRFMAFTKITSSRFYTR